MAKSKSAQLSGYQYQDEHSQQQQGLLDGHTNARSHKPFRAVSGPAVGASFIEPSSTSAIRKPSRSSDRDRDERAGSDRSNGSGVSGAHSHSVSGVSGFSHSGGVVHSVSGKGHQLAHGDSASELNANSRSTSASRPSGLVDVPV